EPEPGHVAPVKLEAGTTQFTLVTQNVDGLHDRAGSRSILKVHGDIRVNRCCQCGREVDTLPEGRLPRCACGGLFRPGVVWFGEALPQDVWRASEEAAATADVM